MIDIKETILFVDDEESILDIANEYFQQKGYRVITARNGVDALKVLEKERVDCCFTDINMPEMDGLKLAEHIRMMDNTIPVIIMTGYPTLDNTIRTLKNGVVDFLIKPVNLSQMEICVRRVLRERRLFVENLILKKEVEGKDRLIKLNQELSILNKVMHENLMQVLEVIVGIIEARDPDTRNHSSRVTHIALAICKEMKCAEEDIAVLNIAGPLHDIGKIGIPDAILLKPARLTRDEFEIIKRHSVIGADIIGKLGIWEKERIVIRHHHERFDGGGYPDGLKEDKIPMLDRILSVADVYDAMANDRTYRKKMNSQTVMNIITEGAGTQFDPSVVEAFHNVYNKGIDNLLKGNDIRLLHPVTTQ